MNDSVYREFEMYFPSVAEKVVEWHRGISYEIIVTTSDGEMYSYYMIHKTLRKLPTDEMLGLEVVCRKEFGIRLSRLMCNKNITQAELSEKTGITQSNISNYISGKKTPSFFTVDKIARAMNCSTDDFRFVR